MRRSDDWLGSDGESLSRLVIRLLINAVAVWTASHVVTGITPLNQPSSVILVAVILGAINALIKPLFQLITCPIQILTLGLFTLIVNAAMLGITSWVAGQLGIGFHVDGFPAAFLGALVISIVSWILSGIV